MGALNALFKLRDHTVGIAHDSAFDVLRACGDKEDLPFEDSSTVRCISRIGIAMIGQRPTVVVDVV